MFRRPPLGSDGSFTAWLERDASVRPPDVLLEQVLARTRATRRRPGWLVTERWFPMYTTARFGAIPRSAIILIILGLLLALAGATVVGSQPSTAPRPGAFIPGPALAGHRASHTATLLPDGRVLPIGGYSNGVDVGAEISDPVTGAFRPTVPVPPMRYFHTATELPGGRVLIVGGLDAQDATLDSAELWDSDTGSFSPAGSTAQAHSLHAATLLRDGRVLVVGGYGDVASAELWDPDTSTFSPAGSLAEARAWHSATLLPDDRVLITGGPAMAELWDPNTLTFSPAGSLHEARWWGTATLLDDGKVLIVGGMAGEAFDANAGAVGTAELWDPGTLTFSLAGTLGEPRGVHTATLLPDGRVLIVGGIDIAGDPRASAEL